MKRPTIDTAFKWLDKWQEFEIEAWFPEFARSVVVARAFTTCQSAQAHQILFRELFKVAEEDTGQKIHFRHIHGSGIDTVTADGHEGQALGLGLYCQEICKEMETTWSVEWDKPMYMLMPVQHLGCMYMYCRFHLTRNVRGLRGNVKPNVIAAMMSLASADPLPNFEEVVQTICNGGPKALNWYKNKEKGDSVTLAAIYRPKSKIPLEIWKAAPSTSNGNEQAHRNINRDGTKLTMLAGIMRGLQFDSRAMSNIDLWMAESIPPRDRLATHFHRSERGVRVKTSIQQRNVLAKDLEILTTYQKVKQLQEAIVVDATTVKKALNSATEELERAPKRRRKNDGNEEPSKTFEELERAQKRLRNLDEQLTETQTLLASLLPQGSGSHTIPKLPKPEELYDCSLLDAKPEKKLTKNIKKMETAPSNSHHALQNQMPSTSCQPHLHVTQHQCYENLPSQPLHQYQENLQAQRMPQNSYYGRPYNNSSQPQNVYAVGSQPQNVYAVGSQPQHNYYIGSQPQNVYSVASQSQNSHHIGFQPQHGYFIRPQPTNTPPTNLPTPHGFHNASQLVNVHQYAFTNPAGMIQHSASSLSHHTAVSSHFATGCTHAYPPNVPPQRHHYHDPGYYSQPGPFYPP